jgi:hypothetical protein
VVEIFIVVESAAAAMLAPFVFMQAIRHAGHVVSQLHREAGVESERRRRAVMRIGARLDALGPEPMNHQGPLAAGRAFRQARMAIGTERGVHGQRH